MVNKRQDKVYMALIECEQARAKAKREATLVNSACGLMKRRVRR